MTKETKQYIEWERKEQIRFYENQIKNYENFPQDKPTIKKYIQNRIKNIKKEIKYLKGLKNTFEELLK